MTLNNPEPAPREIVCDLNAFIVNYYRSVVFDYEQTAYWADWPTNHHDLTARHRWLLEQGPELSERMVSDPHDFDAKIAGWWVWGQSSWIGHGWCDPAPVRQAAGCDKRPYAGGTNGQGRGVQTQVGGEPHDKRPHMDPRSGGQGVQQQRDQIPHINNTNSGGKGVSAQRVAVGEPPDQIPGGCWPRTRFRRYRRSTAADRYTGRQQGRAARRW